jgi:hypothetical protein
MTKNRPRVMCSLLYRGVKNKLENRNRKTGNWETGVPIPVPVWKNQKSGTPVPVPDF